MKYVVITCNLQKNNSDSFQNVKLFLNSVTIHKQSREFSRIFYTPLPHDGSFLVPCVGNFDQFFNVIQYQSKDSVYIIILF